MPKVSKVSKRTSKTSAVPTAPAGIWKCPRCGREYTKQKGMFPLTFSQTCKGNDGYSPFCYVCYEDMFTFYRKKYESDTEGMKRVCMLGDLYWSPELFESVRPNMGNSLMPAKEYISRLTQNRWNGKTYEDTINDEAAAVAAEAERRIAEEMEAKRAAQEAEEEAAREAAQEVYVPAPKTIQFWGQGLQPEMYRELDARFKKWTKNVPKPMDEGTEGLYKQLCLGEVNILQNMKAGKGIEAGQKVVSDIMTKLGISPDKQVEENDTLGIETTPMGVWVRRWEDKRPLPEEDEDMKDENHVIRYIHTWFLGHIGKMLGIKNIYTKMYEDEIAKYSVDLPETEDVDDDEIMNAILGAEIEEGDAE